MLYLSNSLKKVRKDAKYIIQVDRNKQLYEVKHVQIDAKYILLFEIQWTTDLLVQKMFLDL